MPNEDIRKKQYAMRAGTSEDRSDRSHNTATSTSSNSAAAVDTNQPGYVPEPIIKTGQAPVTSAQTSQPAPPLTVTPESQQAAATRAAELASKYGGAAAEIKGKTAEAAPTTGYTAEGKPVTGEDVGKVSTEDMFTTAEKKIQDIFAGREGDVNQIVEAIKGMGDLRQSAFDKLYGEDSRISQFYSPSIQAVEEQILDTEELLTNLKGDIVSRTKDVGLTQEQFRRIEAKERGDLVDQMDKLARANERLRAGLDIQLALSDKEFENVIQGAQDEIDALTFKLEQSGKLDEEEISLVKKSLEQQLSDASDEAAENRQIAYEMRQEGRDINAEIRAEQAQIRSETREEKAAKAQGLQELLSEMQNFVLESGVVPTGNFQTVMDKAMKDFEAGKTLAEIQLDLIRAIGDNPEVRAYIQNGMEKVKSGSSGGGGGGSTSTAAEGTAITGGGEDLYSPIKMIATQTGQYQEPSFLDQWAAAFKS